MRRAALLAVPLILSGCSGLGKYFHDTIFWPGYTPNQPKGNSETLLRVRGQNVTSEALLPNSGNIWPAAPQPLPTLQDVANPNSQFNRNLGNSAAYIGGSGLDGDHSSASLPSSGPKLKSGGTLSIGETASMHTGVSPDYSNIQALPTNVPDAAGRYLEKQGSRSITIPNGNGTSTIISADGSTRTVKDSTLPRR